MEMSPSALDKYPDIVDMLLQDSEESTIDMDANGLVPELELLFCCARTKLTPPYLERLNELLQEDIDWQEVAGLAAFHRVQPLLYQNLKQADSDAVPSNLLDHFGRVLRMSAMRNLTLIKEMERLTRRFGDNGIPAIAFKGALLAQRAYGNLGIRPCVDLDILIPKEAFGEVEEILAADGYRHVPKTRGMEGIKKSFYLYLARQCTFVRPPAHGLDIHTAVMPPGYYPFDFDALQRRSQMLPVAGTRVPGFAPEDLLLILCFHGVKNRWEALKHVCDVAEVIRSHPDMNLDVVAERARSVRGERILGLGLYMAHTLLDADVPPNILQRARNDRYIKPLAETMMSYLRRSHTGILNAADRMQFHLQVQNSVPTKARYLYYCLMRYVQDAATAISAEKETSPSSEGQVDQ